METCCDDLKVNMSSWKFMSYNFVWTPILQSFNWTTFNHDLTKTNIDETQKHIKKHFKVINNNINFFDLYATATISNHFCIQMMNYIHQTWLVFQVCISLGWINCVVFHGLTWSRYNIFCLEDMVSKILRKWCVCFGGFDCNIYIYIRKV